MYTAEIVGTTLTLTSDFSRGGGCIEVYTFEKS